MNIFSKSDNDGDYSIAPLTVTQALAKETDNGSEWMRLPAPKDRLWGLSRTTWIELIDSKLVKGITLRKRNAVRGIRMIYRPSAEAYFKSLIS